MVEIVNVYLFLFFFTIRWKKNGPVWSVTEESNEIFSMMKTMMMLMMVMAATVMMVVTFVQTDGYNFPRSLSLSLSLSLGSYWILSVDSLEFIFLSFIAIHIFHIGIIIIIIIRWKKMIYDS